MSNLSEHLSKAELETENERALSDALFKLNRLIRDLKIFSSLTVAGTMFHLTVGAWAIFLLFKNPTAVVPRPYDPVQFSILMEIIMLVIVFGFSFIFDRLTASGEALYQEISDELEWQIKATEDTVEPNKVSTKERPGLAIRLTMREYVLATRLAFVPGPYGVRYYLVINLFIFILYFSFIIYSR